MDILLASNNVHKLLEVARLFPGHSVLSPAEAGISFRFEETGSTFLENAMGKARALFDACRTPVLADDSGLCVPSLGGEPGIFSSRYGSNGGRVLSTPERNAYLLSRMGGLADRSAYFVCCMVLLLGEDRYLVAQETVHGTITTAPRGSRGFGYDPLFLVPGTGKTVAELPDEEKDRLSHRGRAARRILLGLGGGG
jgi:XTP/dITP diphosphohydrolase